MKTYYIVQGFARQGTGKNNKLLGTVIQCKTENEAPNRAERLAEKHAGVIAAAQRYGEDSSEYGDVKIFLKYGGSY